MPQLKPLVINDGTADLTFQPKKIDANGVASLIRRGAQPGVYHSLSLSLNGDEKTGHVANIRLGVPSVYTVPGSGEQVIATDFVEMRFKLASLGTVTSRTQLVNLVKDSLADADIVQMLTNLEAVY